MKARDNPSECMRKIYVRPEITYDFLRASLKVSRKSNAVWAGVNQAQDRRNESALL